MTNEMLDAARLRGDALADATVAAVFAAGDTPAVAQLLSTLMRDDQAAPALPPPVADYLRATAQSVTASQASARPASGSSPSTGPRS